MSAGIELERYADRSVGRVGDNDFNQSIETKYQNLRKKAEIEHAKKSDCMKRSHEAYERGDGAGAKQLSNEGKQHAAKADKLDLEASKLIFAMNNANADGDVIDLHGQQVDEAIIILTKRIQEDQQDNQTHLHVIVGKGNHSVGHVPKLKPAVEDLFQQLGLQYKTEENAGRLYVNLQGDNVTHMPPLQTQPATQYAGHGGQSHGGHQQQHYPAQQHHQPQHQQQQQQHYGGQNQEEQQYDEVEKLLTKLVKKYCCTVM
ncbi:DUF1771-domain-containing protein [Hypoxylon argillaceum]|nr:DUF1771-domain-containing protein [Hypoxylon argillaceum]